MHASIRDMGATIAHRQGVWWWVDLPSGRRLWSQDRDEIDLEAHEEGAAVAVMEPDCPACLTYADPLALARHLHSAHRVP